MEHAMTNIEIFHLLTLIVTGLYLIAGGLLIHTKNGVSGLLFKFIPFVLGLCCLLSAIKLQNWI